MDQNQMDPSAIFTAEQFSAQQFELPDGGRWMELEAGKLITLSPPDDVHGNVVLNFTKALAEHAQKAQDGYACFELGLILSRNPDTVRFPAVSYFQQGDRFAELDHQVTENVPALVVEIASSNDRRQNVAGRIERYLQWGVQQVWLADTQKKEMHIFDQARSKKRFAPQETLVGGSILSEFQTRVEDLFAAPSWYA